LLIFYLKKNAVLLNSDPDLSREVMAKQISPADQRRSVSIAGIGLRGPRAPKARQRLKRQALWLQLSFHRS
jgi:hypothetical protein